MKDCVSPDSSDQEKKPRPPTPVIKCPNCEEDTLVLNKSEHVWRCQTCGYVQEASD